MRPSAQAFLDAIADAAPKFDLAELTPDGAVEIFLPYPTAVLLNWELLESLNTGLPFTFVPLVLPHVAFSSQDAFDKVILSADTKTGRADCTVFALPDGCVSTQATRRVYSRARAAGESIESAVSRVETSLSPPFTHLVAGQSLAYESQAYLDAVSDVLSFWPQGPYDHAEVSLTCELPVEAYRRLAAEYGPGHEVVRGYRVSFNPVSPFTSLPPDVVLVTNRQITLARHVLPSSFVSSRIFRDIYNEQRRSGEGIASSLRALREITHDRQSKSQGTTKGTLAP